MTTTTVEGRSLWYALLAPPSAWALQGLLGWAFGERSCTSLTPPTVRWIVAAISVAALIVALIGVRRGWSMWREVSDACDPLVSEHRDRVAFMAFGGFLVSSVFSIGIFWNGLSAAFLNDCGRMR